MPRVTFVNEHRVVEADAGKTVGEIARAAGVAIGKVCWVDGAVNAPTWLEKVRGMRGARRSPDAAVVTGDVKVHSAPAAGDRVAKAREIAPPPSPVADPTAPRKPNDAASTAAHVHGHPSMVGRGAAPDVADIPRPPESHPNAARPMPTVPPPPEKE